MSKNTVTSAYNDDWRKKLEDPGRIEYQQRVMDTFENLFHNILGSPLHGRVLDLGCGDGSVTEAFRRRGLDASGIDIGHGVDFEADPLPHREDEFDIVLMYSVIEHIYNPGNMLAEVRRVLKKGGKLLVITPNFDLAHWLTCEKSFYDDPTHVHPYSPTSLEHLMKLYRFKKSFLGLWTVKKSAALWRLPMRAQFYVGALLPFRGTTRWAPPVLRGRSNSILAVFQNEK
jgi:SAM-dependent methyltransferase